MIDILITTYNRLDFLKQTIESLIRDTGDVPHRVSIIDDASTDGTREYIDSMRYFFHRAVLSEERHGIVPNFNRMWDLIMDEGDYEFFCYLQDDMVSEVRGWLPILLVSHLTYGEAYNCGFSTAYDAPEHIPTYMLDHEKYAGLRLKIKRSSSMQNMFAEKAFWKSIGKPPELDADGNTRGFPSDGRGSDIDTWFTGCYSLNRFSRKASSPNCLSLQGKRVLAVPMLRHLGIEKVDSTWRQNRQKGF